MNGWFIALILIYSVDVVGNLVMHGERKQGKYNFFSALIVTIVTLWIAYNGMIVGF